MNNFNGAAIPLICVQSIMRDHPEHQRLKHDCKYGAGAAYIIDHYCPIDQAKIPITDAGFAHADAAYDVTTATRGLVFRLDEHLQRFESSCREFRLRNPYTREQTKQILFNLIKKTGYKDCYIWWCVTRGEFPPGLDKINPDAYQNRFYAYVTDYRFYANDPLRQRGLDIIVAKNAFRISENAVNPRAKNFHWMDMTMAMFEAFDRGFQWPVLTDAEGYLTEAPGSNLVIVKNRELYTPDKGCLEGITRKSVLEIAAQLGMKSYVKNLCQDQLLNADEALLTTSAGGIVPINSVDGTLLGGADGPGKYTVAIHNKYWEDRWKGWHGECADYISE